MSKEASVGSIPTTLLEVCQEIDTLVLKRNELIREVFEQEVSLFKIKEVTRLSEAKIYQIVSREDALLAGYPYK